MASTTSKTPCVTCVKGTGIFKCEGCTQTFCTKHVVEHRQTLHHQLDEIIAEHDTLQEILIENKDQGHPLMYYIDDWEQKSIKKIQQMAKMTRQTLAELTDTHKITISEELKLLTKRIKTAREEDDFFETDLNDWISTLDRLKNELKNVPLSNNIKEDRSIPLIYQLTVEFNDKISVNQDIFAHCLQGAQIEDNGRLIVHNKISSAVEIRGKFEYSFGIHQVRLQIEKSSLGTWIFFGIISKSELMIKNSYESSSAYGWADYNDYFLAGIRQNNRTTGQLSHTVENDIISLVFDCTNRKISYTNERSQCNQQLNIDINKCPFPWQLHVNLFGEDDRVRLLDVRSAL